MLAGFHTPQRKSKSKSFFHESLIRKQSEQQSDPQEQQNAIPQEQQNSLMQQLDAKSMQDLILDSEYLINIPYWDDSDSAWFTTTRVSERDGQLVAFRKPVTKQLYSSVSNEGPVLAEDPRPL